MTIAGNLCNAGIEFQAVLLYMPRFFVLMGSLRAHSARLTALATVRASQLDWEWVWE